MQIKATSTANCTRVDASHKPASGQKPVSGPATDIVNHKTSSPIDSIAAKTCGVSAQSMQDAMKAIGPNFMSKIGPIQNAGTLVPPK